MATIEARDRYGGVTGSDESDARGWFGIALSPGEYTLHVAIEGVLPHCPDVPVTAASDGPSRADIDCDTGIR